MQHKLFTASPMRRSGVYLSFSIIDDLLTASDTIKEHEQHLQLVSAWLSQCSIIINPAKYQFGVPSLKILGHLINKHGIHRPADKVKAIQD